MNAGSGPRPAPRGPRRPGAEGGLRRRLTTRLESGPFAVLGAAALVGAVVSAFVNVAALAAGGDVAHLRDLQAVGIPARVATLFGSNLIYALPAVLARSRDLSTVAGLLSFGAGALLLTLALSAGVFALVAFPTAIASRRWPPEGGRSRLREWWWKRAFPAAALVGFCFPAIQALAIAMAHGLWEERPLVLRAVACAAVAWVAVAARPRRWSRLARPLAAAACASALAGSLLLLGAGLAAAATAMTAARVQPAPAPGAPNLLLVSIDTLRADHLGCYGYARDTTPVIDALARGGALFRNAFAHTPWTLPSHLTLLSGLPPEVHQVSNDRQRLAPGVGMLEEYLWAAGYATAGFVSLPYLRAEYGFGRGFDTYDDWSVAEREFGRFRSVVSSPTVVARALDWLSRWYRRGRARPFFVFVHLADVHNYSPPAPYDTMFGPGGIEESLYTRAYRGPLDARDLARVVGAYDGGLRSADAAVGAVLAALRADGVLDDTVVVITGDHGEEFYDHGKFGHGRQLYDESLRVPLVIRFPGRVPRGTDVEQAVGLVDVVPTVVGLLGARGTAPGPATPPPLREFGHDLAPLLRGGSVTPGPGWPLFGGLRGTQAFVRWQGFKLIRHLSDSAPEELYDLRTDPGERHNIVAAAPGTAATLGALLDDWRRRCAAAAKPAATFRPDAEQLRDLRALGYL